MPQVNDFSWITFMFLFSSLLILSKLSFFYTNTFTYFCGGKCAASISSFCFII